MPEHLGEMHVPLPEPFALAARRYFKRRGKAEPVWAEALQRLEEGRVILEVHDKELTASREREPVENVTEVFFPGRNGFARKQFLFSPFFCSEFGRFFLKKQCSGIAGCWENPFSAQSSLLLCEMINKPGKKQ